MATITTRSGKGSPLTNTEVDDNFTNLNTAKYESGNNVTLGTIGSDTVTITHNTFKQGLIIKRNHASNAASIVFKNNTGEQGTLYATHADGQLKWRSGASEDGHEVWNAGNDGANSGLDADKLDGIHASGFLRSNAADTATHPITFNHAPILAGTSGDEGGEINFGAPTGGVHSAFNLDNYQGHFRVHTLKTGKEIRFHGDDGNTTINQNIGTVWGSGNDGSGSGLDADKLDGIDSTGFIKTERGTGFTTTGAGWYRVAFSDSPNGRGSFQIKLFTYGGSNAISETILHGVKNYVNSAAPAISFIEHIGPQKRWAKIRGVHAADGKAYIEAYTEDARADMGIQVTYEGVAGFHIPTETALVAATGTNSAESDEYVVQMNHASFINQPMVNGNDIWHAGNDGAGSGLDADTVDGIHGSALALRAEALTASNFVTSVAKGDFVRVARVTGDKLSTSVKVHFQGTTGNVVVNSISDILVNHSQDIQVASNGSDYEAHWLKIIVDGDNNNFDLYFKYADNASNGSPLGLETTIQTHGDDTIIGNPDDTAYPPYSGSNTFTHHINSSEVKYGQSGDATVDIKTDGNFFSDGNKLFHAGNDGTGSGLDADLLDGVEGSGYVIKSGDSEITGTLTVKYDIKTHIISAVNSPHSNFGPQSLILNAGESEDKISDSDQNGEYIYLNSEGGTIVSTPDSDHSNWETGYTVETTMIKGSSITVQGNTVWHAGNDGSSSGLDADLLDGKEASAFPLCKNGTVATDFNNYTTSGNYYVNNWYNTDGTNAVLNGPTYTAFSGEAQEHTQRAYSWGVLRVSNFHTNDDFVLQEYIPHQTDGTWIRVHWGNHGWTAWRQTHSNLSDGVGSDVDARRLNGLEVNQFIRSDTNDTFSGALVSTNRSNGIFGNYDSTKTDQIWSIGTNYKNDADGEDFGNLYGLAYKHTNNLTGGTMAGAHQMVWCKNGIPKCALGDNVWSAGNVTAYSDIRVKTNIERIPDALDKVSQLSGYTFDRTDIAEDEEPLRQTGVIAQEVLEVLPEAVTGDEDGHYSVAYGNMVGLLIEAIKELKDEVAELKGEQNDAS